MGHGVRLSPTLIRAALREAQQDDAANAEAIWKADQRPGVKSVAAKNEARQGVLALHRVREQLIACQLIVSFISDARTVDS